MSDELFALVEAAEQNQKAVAILTDRAEAAIAKLEKLPEAITNKLAHIPANVSRETTETVQKTLNEATYKAAKNLNELAKHLRGVGAWWPLIFAVFVLGFFALGVHMWERKTLKNLESIKAEIQAYQRELNARKVELARTPKVVMYTTSDGKEAFGVQVSESARPMQMNSGIWLINFN